MSQAKEKQHENVESSQLRRYVFGTCAIARVMSLSAQVTPGSGALTKERRDRMTPGQVIDELKKGHERFLPGKMLPHDYRDQQRSSAAGQFPAAVVLGCIDSRAPAEVIFDTGIGDTFNARIAGNVVNDDLLGSLEFACAVAGAKVILLFGHTACGAVKGAIDDVEMGNLTGLLARIKPAISATTFSGDKSSKTQRMSMRSRGRTSGWAWRTSAAEAPFSRASKRKGPFRSLARCTTW